MSGRKDIATNRFADYFVICGLDISSGLEQDYNKHSCESLQCSPLDRPFKARVLAHYPDEVSWNPFDKDAIVMLSLPRGLTFRTHRQSRDCLCHPFLITKEDGTRVYGTSLTFYEEVLSLDTCKAMQTLFNMYNAEQGDSDASTLPRSRSRSRDSSPSTPRKVPRSKGYDMRRDRLFVTKCITLITQVPLLRTCERFLHQLYEAAFNDEAPPLPLESYVYNILYEVPSLPPGKSMKFYGVNAPIFCQRPSLNELPLLDMPLYQLFKLLKEDSIIKIFSSMLLEHQVLLFSTDLYRLMLVTEGITALMFPFIWQHVYVPILPVSLLHFLEAPVPYIMGIRHSGHDQSQIHLPCAASMCIVNIDKNIVELPEELPAFPHTSGLKDEIKQLLAKYQPVLGNETNNYTQTLGRYRKLKSHLTTPTKQATTGTTTLPHKQSVLQQSEAFLRISAIAKRTGVLTSADDIANIDDVKSQKISSDKESNGMQPKQLDQLKFNNAIREIFLNRFVCMFQSYESFVIQPTQEMEAWLNNRESMQNFDKAAFLGDQPETRLPFLSSFIETQMFTTFIDNKVTSHWEDAESYLKLFDDRVLQHKSNCDMPKYCHCDTYRPSDVVLENRSVYMDHIAVRPSSLSQEAPVNHTAGMFPILNKSLLNTEPVRVVRTRDIWRKRGRLLQHSEHLQMNTEQREKYMQDARSKSIHCPSLSDMKGSNIEMNWKFVETLLSECKSKSKRMLVEKMGREAVELGHGDLRITGVEENTLIASLCDLLERIWGHGLQESKSKSALWCHLLSFQDTNLSQAPPTETAPVVTSSSDALPDLSSLGMDSDKPKLKGHGRKGSNSRLELPTLKPMTKSLVHDLRSIQEMSTIKTDVGLARAFIRLALEKKLLSAHLKELLQDHSLLRRMYKRYAFLRCEDEREQFLYHLLSLNAVDYFCFTNTFPNTMISYLVLIYPSTKMGSHTSANAFLSLAGQMGHTGLLDIPKGCLEFTIQHKNLGVLTTLTLGHDNTGMTPRWLVEFVLVRNQLTGHIHKFVCGRWLGKGVDDGSIERLLVGQLVHKMENITEEISGASSCNTPPRHRSPSLTRRSITEQSLTVPDIQEMLGQAVNNIVKYFYKPEKERGNFTFLLCGESGLVKCMETVFLFGFRSSRLFRQKFFIWDYFERLRAHFESLLEGQGQPLPNATKAGYWLFCRLLNKINESSLSIGKDGKFQIFVCVGMRDHCLQSWLSLMANTSVTTQMYEENSFMRSPSLTNFLVQILDTLQEFPITLESSLTRGLEI